MHFWGICALVVALGVAALITPAAAQRVVDGDTIDLNGIRWRLWALTPLRRIRPAPLVGRPDSRRRPPCAGSSKARPSPASYAAMTATGAALAYVARTARIWARRWSAPACLGFTRYSSDYVGEEKAAIGAKVGDLRFGPHDRPGYAMVDSDEPRNVRTSRRDAAIAPQIRTSMTVIRLLCRRSDRSPAKGPQADPRPARG